MLLVEILIEWVDEAALLQSLVIQRFFFSLSFLFFPKTLQDEGGPLVDWIFSSKIPEELD